MLFFQQKMSLLCFFISRSRSLLPFFSLSFAGQPPNFSFPLSPQALYSKFVDMTTQIQKQFPLSVFVVIDSLVVSALQDAGEYAISLQNNLELHLGCHTC